MLIILLLLLLFIGLKIGMEWWYYTISGLMFTASAISVGIKIANKDILQEVKTIE